MNADIRGVNKPSILGFKKRILIQSTLICADQRANKGVPNRVPCQPLEFKIDSKAVEHLSEIKNKIS